MTKKFVISIVRIVFTVGVITSIILFFCCFDTRPALNANGELKGYKENYINTDYLIASISTFIGTCVFSCFLILGVLKVNELEKIAQATQLGVTNKATSPLDEID